MANSTGKTNVFPNVYSPKMPYIPRPELMDSSFGYESVLRSHFRYCKTKYDVLVIWLHWVLLKSLFKAKGGEGELTNYLTENLPKGMGWNGEKKTYLLKYEFNCRNHAVGIWVRNDVVEVSIVTLEKCMRVGILVDTLLTKEFKLDTSTA